MSDNLLFPRDFDPEIFNPCDVSSSALAFWSKLRPQLFSKTQLAILLDSGSGAELLTTDFEPFTFALASQRVRTWIELQDLHLAPDYLRQLHRLQRNSDDPDSPQLRREAARAGLSGADYQRWEDLDARVAHLDEQLQLAQVRREWIECAGDENGRAQLRDFNSQLKDCETKLKRAPRLEARIVLGLRQGFDGPTKSLDQVRDALRTHLQNELWSVTITATEIIYQAGTEAGVEVALIDDPRFPVGEVEFKNRAMQLAQRLLSEFEQQRLCVLFGDECVMLEAESPQ